MGNSASFAVSTHPDTWQSLSEGQYSTLVQRRPDKGYRVANASNVVSRIDRVLEDSAIGLVKGVEVAPVGHSHSRQRRWRSRLQALARLAQIDASDGDPTPSADDFRLAGVLLEQIELPDSWRVGIFLESEGSLEIRLQLDGSSDHIAVVIAERGLSTIVMRGVRAEFGEFAETQSAAEWIATRLAV